MNGAEIDVVIAGGGPAGVLLGHLLAREGLSVTVLEACQDFDREFRGDALTPSTLMVMQSLGLADDMLKLQHSKIYKIDIETAQGPVTVTDYSLLPEPFNYVCVLPQPRFLDLLVARSRVFPGFRLIHGARVSELIWQGETVKGVIFKDNEGQPQELRARLVVGADGRHSQIRQMIGEKATSSAPPMDVLWMNVPRYADDSPSRNLTVAYGKGFYLALTDRQDKWTIAYVVKKGAFRHLREAGIIAFRESIANLIPEFRERLHLLDWPQVRVLSVESSRTACWHREGLLLIGDAAHVMSSVGGFGIQCAIQDSVVAANILAEPLLRGRLTRDHLASVQRSRQFFIWLIQKVQRAGQQAIIARILDPDRPYRVPFYLKLGFMRRLTAWMVAYGFHVALPKPSPSRGPVSPPRGL